MATTTAGLAAIELRKLADALDKEPNAEIKRPCVFFSHWDEKDDFLRLISLLPRPLRKSVSDGDFPRLKIEYESAGIDIDATILQNSMCELVEPAKPAVYRCAPLLSLEEESALTESEAQNV